MKKEFEEMFKKSENKILALSEMPITEEERAELEFAFSEWTNWADRRRLWKEKCEDRLAEKKNRAIKKLVYEEKVFAIQYMDSYLKNIAQDLRSKGYSCNAISEASYKAISTSWVVAYTENDSELRPRGQVIQLLDDLDDFDLNKWRLAGSYNTQHGSQLTEEEKEEIVKLYIMGYSIIQISKKMGRSMSAVRRQVEKNGLAKK